MQLRSVRIDGPALGRTGDVIQQIVPLADGRHAWVVGYGQASPPMWRVHRWSLADGALVELRTGAGTAFGIAARAGRLYLASDNQHVSWIDVETGVNGAIRIGGGHELVAYSPDGEYLATHHRDDRRDPRARILPVGPAGGEPFAEVPRPLVFTDDARFAVHLTAGGAGLAAIALADRAARPLAVDPPAGRWRGVRPVRGTSQVAAWDDAAVVLVEVDPAAGGGAGVRARIPIADLAAVDDATAARAAITRRAGRPPADDAAEVIELPTGRSLARLGGGRAVLTPDGRLALRGDRAMLDAIDLATGAPLVAHRGPRRSARHLAWSPDGTRVAAADDDGRIRITSLVAPDDAAVVELTAGPGARLAFVRDGHRLGTVTASEIAVWDAATGAALARYASFGTHIGAVEVTADGAYLAACSYTHGVRVVDLATGAHVVVEHAETAPCTTVAITGPADLVALRTERLAGPRHPRPAELVHWVRLDGRGAPVGRGTWRFDEVGFGSIQLAARGTTAMVLCAPQLHVLDLGDPAAPARVVAAPRGAKLLDVRGPYALVLDGSALVCLDTAAGGEHFRLPAPRPALGGSLAPDGAGVAVAYTDAGLEVFRA